MFIPFSWNIKIYGFSFVVLHGYMYVMKGIENKIFVKLKILKIDWIKFLTCFLRFTIVKLYNGDITTKIKILDQIEDTPKSKLTIFDNSFLIYTFYISFNNLLDSVESNCSIFLWIVIIFDSSEFFFSSILFLKPEISSRCESNFCLFMS